MSAAVLRPISRRRRLESAWQALVRRAPFVFAAAAVVVAACVVGATAPGAVQASAAPVASARQVAAAHPTVDVGTAKAYVVVDVSSGRVVAAHNAREPLRVASTVKIITALVARRVVPLDDAVPISAYAESRPALKISVKQGQHWNADDLFHSMLLASANDAAVALAERAGGGSLDGFEGAAAAEATRLGLADKPLIQDPAGLDDESSVRGGNRISARDLAIAARALLSDPLLASIVAMPDYRFVGGDGQHHRVVGHNEFMQSYPGAVGVKTGYTKLSGSSLVAAARRDGKTYLAVLVDSPNAPVEAGQLLDAAFAGKVQAGLDDTLPAVRGADFYAGVGSNAGAARPTVHVGVPSASPLRSGMPVFAVLAGLVLLVMVRRRQVVVQRQQARARRARPPSARPSR